MSHQLTVRLMITVLFVFLSTVLEGANASPIAAVNDTQSYGKASHNAGDSEKKGSLGISVIKTF